jgi:hypothetical protein
VKAHSVIDALSGNKRTKLPFDGKARNRMSEASTTPP